MVPWYPPGNKMGWPEPPRGKIVERLRIAKRHGAVRVRLRKLTGDTELNGQVIMELNGGGGGVRRM